MSIFGRLFGTEKAIENITDSENGLIAKAGGWFDRQQFTEEEKAEHRQEVRKWGLSQLEALQPFKIVQRILAFAIASVWVLTTVNVLTSIWLYSADPSADLLSFAFSDFVFWPVTVCFGLYFGGGLIESLRQGGAKK